MLRGASVLLCRRPACAATAAAAAAAAAARRFTSLPVINVAPLIQPGAPVAAASRVAGQLHEACRDVGFFYVEGHGVPPEVTRGVLDRAREFFALPEAAKRRLLLGPQTWFRGWQPLGANVTRHEGGFARDVHEALDLFREHDAAAAAAAGRPPSPLHGPNPPLGCVPGLPEAVAAYVSECQRLGAALLRGIAQGLGLGAGFFGGGLASPEESYWVLRMIHYPPVRAAAGTPQAAAAGGAEVGRAVQLSCGEHTDYGLLTLVNQDEGVTALQVKNAQGSWVDAPPLPGTFVVNVGDVFEVLTNGLYRPTLHRVVNTAGASPRPRVSAPFFYEPGFEALVAPAPQLCGGSPPRFAPMRYGSHLESKVLTNFE